MGCLKTAPDAQTPAAIIAHVMQSQALPFLVHNKVSRADYLAGLGMHDNKWRMRLKVDGLDHIIDGIIDIDVFADTMDMTLLDDS
jgi:hypothetical protein